ncbi:MAG TPA: TonB-dependent receptor plug domain-containing protein [Bacteroidales bacterium]|nr:TonB-dependent receptor plug domain-containing protein [Bacteroidales bacterium]
MKRIFFTLFFSALFIGAFAQNNGRKLTITGTVLDVSGAPVRNAIVMIDGNKTNAVTNESGRYRIRVPANAETIGILTFGHGMIGELIDGRNEINFRYSATVQNIETPGDEQVNTGYSSQKKKDLLTDVSKVDGRKKNYSSYSSVSEMIERECSGVRATGSGFIIQDSKNLQGPIPALLILDGVPVSSFSGVSTSSVESIEVLKGTSAAIYGSRGYGGAILLTTKKQ